MAENDLILEGLTGFQFKGHNPALRITQSKQWSMVVIRDSRKQSELSVFPPVNHENLQIPSQQNQNQEHPLPQSTSSYPSEVTEVAPASNERGYAEWFEFGIEVLRAKMTRFASLLGFRTGGVGGAAWRILRVVGVAAVVVSWWLCRRAWWRMRRRDWVDQLERIIDEKDEKIAQLLHQIAQMNQLLIERHKAARYTIQDRGRGRSYGNADMIFRNSDRIIYAVGRRQRQ